MKRNFLSILSTIFIFLIFWNQNAYASKYQYNAKLLALSMECSGNNAGGTPWDAIIYAVATDYTIQGHRFWEQSKGEKKGDLGQHILTGSRTDKALVIDVKGKWLKSLDRWDMRFTSMENKSILQHLKNGVVGYSNPPGNKWRRECKITLENSVFIDSALYVKSHLIQISRLRNQVSKLKKEELDNIEVETKRVSEQYQKIIDNLNQEISDSKNNLEFEEKFEKINKKHEDLEDKHEKVQQEKSNLENEITVLKGEIVTFKKKEAAEIKRKENEEKEKLIAKKQEEKKIREEESKREERKNNNLKHELISSELVVAQNLIRDLEEFVKSNPSEFDIVEIAELLIENRQILDGTWNEETAISFTKLRGYLNNSENFNQFYNQKEEDRYNKALAQLNQEYESLLSNQKELENKLNENLTSEFAPLIVEKVKIIRNVLKDYTLKLLINTNLEISAFKINLSKQIEEERFEEENKISGIEETHKNLSELKELLIVNLTNNNAPLILEKINYLKDLNTDILDSKSILNINLETREFIYKIGGKPLIETEQSNNNKLNSENQNEKTTDNSLKSNLSELVSYFNTICIEEDDIQTRDGFIYLPNKTKPFTGENLCVYLSNNQYSSKGKIKGGKYEGKWIWWHENGQIWWEGNYKDGKADGKWTEWHENGQIKVEQNFKDDKEDGKWTGWYKNGQIKHESNWKDDKKDGKWTDWHENGKLWWEGNYKDGKADGKWTEWHENGQIKAESNYKDGKLDGKFTQWYENGQIESDRNYKDDELIAETRYSYHVNGQKESESNYKYGKADGIWTYWYESGQKESESNYKDDNFDGKYTQWYESGQKQIEGSHLDGKKHGKWTWWHENGQKHAEALYADHRCISGDC